MQHNSIARSTDSCLLETVRAELVGVAKNAGVDLNQPFAEESK
ncbi:MAG: hypothetical protein Q8S92_16365 [Hydrogenophaga sp.]|nr:hypothetical protein [Hydrogenophaga sp.]MDP3350567.1 hypothetical protein [Hydrogenophaga sp.]MDP3626866.1 hypothetical protein [Hydrogenophaga sp.]